jgi:predicted HAD superfamily Cof-like phosphohydrolase
VIDADCYDWVGCPDGDCENCDVSPAGEKWKEPMQTLHDQVKAFILAGEQLSEDELVVPHIPAAETTTLGIGLIDEEFEELKKAVGEVALTKLVQPETSQEEKIRLLSNVADAIGDLLYVAAWNGLAWGLPMPQIVDEIQRANMAKFGPGSWKDETGKVRKPPGWQPPDLASIIKAHLEQNVSKTTEGEHG